MGEWTNTQATDHDHIHEVLNSKPEIAQAEHKHKHGSRTAAKSSSEKRKNTRPCKGKH